MRMPVKLPCTQDTHVHVHAVTSHAAVLMHRRPGSDAAPAPTIDPGSHDAAALGPQSNPPLGQPVSAGALVLHSGGAASTHQAQALGVEVFVGGLPADAQEEDLKAAFMAAGVEPTAIRLQVCDSCVANHQPSCALYASDEL